MRIDTAWGNIYIPLFAGCREYSAEARGNVVPCPAAPPPRRRRHYRRHRHRSRGSLSDRWIKPVSKLVDVLCMSRTVKPDTHGRGWLTVAAKVERFICLSICKCLYHRRRYEDCKFVGGGEEVERSETPWVKLRSRSYVDRDRDRRDDVGAISDLFSSTITSWRTIARLGRIRPPRRRGGGIARCRY